MGLGANLLVTQLAWTAGHKALNFLPENWKNKISGKRSDREISDFLTNNRGTDIEAIDLFVDGQKVAGIDGNPKEPDPSNRYVSNVKGNKDWFYSIADDFRGGAGYTCMYLRVQGTETIMEIPCVNGSPRISMQVIQNESPTASNELVTTNRRVKPIVFKFSFPIAYLRIYGTNESEGQAEDIAKTKLKEKMDSAKQKLKDGVDSIKEKLGFDSDDIVYDSDIGKGDQIRPRTIPTYSQVLSTLIQFPRQFGCYLYMGFGFSSIGVTCSIDITSQKDNMDCIWVDMTLVETMEFDFNRLTSIKVSDWYNARSTDSANSSGKTINNNAQSVS